jgi:predicted nucleic acid-binding protein
VNFLLDTNVVSEWLKPRPDPGVIRWMESVEEDRIFLSVISLAELRYGVECTHPLARGGTGAFESSTVERRQRQESREAYMRPAGSASPWGS